MGKFFNKKSRTRVRKSVMISMIVLVLSGLSVIGYGAYKYGKMIDGWHSPWGNSDAAAANQYELTDEGDLQPFTLLLIGADSRGEEKSRSDTIMLATIDPQEKQVMLFSIPRDTYVNIHGHGMDKFNHSFFFGGPDLVRQTVEEFLDIKVDHYVTIDFEGFRHMVDELDGIEVDVKKRMVYRDPTDGTDIDLYPGLQVLDGKQALDYARFRKNNIGPDDSDFDRIARQHEIISAFIQKGSQFSSIMKVFSMMDILGEHVKTDLSEKEIRSLFAVFHNFPAGNVVTEDVYGTNRRIDSHGLNLWFYVVTEDERQRLGQLVHEYLQSRSVPGE